MKRGDSRSALQTGQVWPRPQQCVDSDTDSAIVCCVFPDVHCDCGQERNLQLLWIKTYSVSFLCSQVNNTFPLSLHALSLSWSLRPESLSQLESQMTTEKHPLPCCTTPVLFGLPESPCSAWHRWSSLRQMEPALTPLLARGEANRINA